MYREQEYVEKCHCSAPAVAPCASCGRARCAAHLERAAPIYPWLCYRCTQAIGQEMEKKSGGRWVGSTVTGTVLSLGGLIAAGAAGSIVGLPIGLAMFFGMRVWQRAALIKKMGPALSASKGELAAGPEHEPEFPDAPPPRFY